MPLPLTVALAYLAVNLAVMVWLERRNAAGRPPSGRVRLLAAGLRYGLPLLGLVYLVTISGDWLFFLFVALFFAACFWMMDGLLAFTVPTNEPDAMHSGWDDRGRSSSDREPG